MERKRVSSSMVDEIGYDEKEEILEVSFVKGGTYQYYGVSKQTFESILSAKSHGKAIHEEILGKDYRFSKVG